MFSMNRVAEKILNHCKVERATFYKKEGYEIYTAAISIRIPMIDGRILLDSITKNNIVKLEISKNLRLNRVTITEVTNKKSSASVLIPLINKKFGQEVKIEVLRGIYQKTADKIRGENAL